MIYTCLIIFLMIYVYTCLGLELISKNSRVQHLPQVDEHFGDFHTTMITLFQFVSFDSVGAIYKPLILEDGFLALYFFSFMLIVSILLMNMVTAVIVEDAIEQGKADKVAIQIYRRATLRSEYPQLVDIFEALDKNG